MLLSDSSSSVSSSSSSSSLCSSFSASSLVPSSCPSWLLAQLISLLVALSACFTSSLSSFCEVNVPAFQSLFVYFALTGIYGRIFFNRLRTQKGGGGGGGGGGKGKTRDVDTATCYSSSTSTQQTEQDKEDDCVNERGRHADDDDDAPEDDSDSDDFLPHASVLDSSRQDKKKKKKKRRPFANSSPRRPSSSSSSSAASASPSRSALLPPPPAPVSPQHFIPYTTFPLSTPLHYYALLSFLDLSANYVIVRAFRYTSITSISLIDCTSIPAVMAFSYALLKRRYEERHFVGAVVCIAGLCLTVWTDVLYPPTPVGSDSDSDSSGDDSSASKVSPPSNPVLGDVLAFVASVTYALNNTLCELYMKRHDQVEYLFFLGFFGTVFSTVLVLSSDDERHDAGRLIGGMFVDTSTTTGSSSSSSTCPPSLPFFLLLGYVVVITLFYSLISVFLSRSDAALLNISLLTSDAYALLFSFVVQRIVVSPIYFAALGVIVCGVAIYDKGCGGAGGDKGGRTCRYFFLTWQGCCNGSTTDDTNTADTADTAAAATTAEERRADKAEKGIFLAVGD